MASPRRAEVLARLLGWLDEEPPGRAERTIHLDTLLDVSREVAWRRNTVESSIIGVVDALQPRVREAEVGLILPLDVSDKPFEAPPSTIFGGEADEFEPPSIYLIPLTAERYWPDEEYRLRLRSSHLSDLELPPPVQLVYSAGRSLDDRDGREPMQRLLRVYVRADE